jgi:CheY-like chemotaxis protein
VLHVCIVGPDLTSQQTLIEHLRLRHAVTLVAAPSDIGSLAVLAVSDALALEAHPSDSGWRLQLQSVLASAPDLPVILVDGQMTDEDKADAFALGALDFFPASCPVLLAERLEVLAHGRRASNERLDGAASASSQTPLANESGGLLP